MKRTFKIALAISKYIINTTKEKISKLKKEYENIVLNIDNNNQKWHTMNEKPEKDGMILFCFEPNTPEFHYYTVRDNKEIFNNSQSWDNLILLKAKYWAYCDELFNIN